MGAATETVRNSKTASSNVLLKTLDGKVADVLNEILDLNQQMVSEFDRISRAWEKRARFRSGHRWGRRAERGRSAWNR